eukprot:NODE_2052_length_998_cov_113.853530_g1674_i0.p1 GENE.NODE_2052_length_998_cov_113.853530_g1674_i0~~NODE_2052_length_998_cov_113.853530_g1674_i0.p1  ORF type:complete len:252 (+),score=40.90 NODE_2052_length_998_cov_113.853530_g1674_i0:121-876(+)
MQMSQAGSTLSTGTVTRTDVLPNGEVLAIPGNRPCPYWYDLSPLVFPTTTSPLKLLNNWQNYWHTYWEKAGYYKTGNLVALAGLIKPGNGWHNIAELPEGFRPQHRLSAVTLVPPNHRLDILPSGVVEYMGHAHPQGYISLNGIVYAVAGKSSLSLTNGWYHNSSWGQPPCYIRQGNLVVLSGIVVAGSHGASITTLPENIRPKLRMIFACCGADGKVARVDLFPNGEVRYIYAGHGTPWISLVGITFAPK